MTLTAVWVRARAEFRGRWRALLGLALLVGLAGGAVLGAAAGARRTQTAYPRFLQASNAHDVLLSGEAETGLASGFYEAAAALPEVEASALIAGLGLHYVGRDFPPDVAMGPALADLDGGYGRVVDRPNLVAGRLPRPGATDEITINKAFADATAVRVGERLEVRQATDEPVGPSFDLNVVGITINATEVIPVANLDETPSAYLPPDVVRAHIDLDLRGFEGLFLKLRPGIDVALFEQRAQQVADRYPALGGLFFASEAGRPAVVQRALRPQVAALTAFAVLAGLTMLLVIGQALGRQLRLDAVDNATLGALGMSSEQLLAGGLLRSGAVAAVGAVIAVILAVAVSPLTPIGPARLAETVPGVEANIAFLAIGAGVIVLALIAVSLVPAWRAARPRLAAQDAALARPSAIARLFAGTGARPSTTVGVRMALESGRGRTAVPMRATLTGAIIGLAAVIAAVAFGASLDRLVSTPRLYGQDWDILSDTQFGAVFDSLVERVRTDPSVEAASGGIYGRLVVGDEVVPAVGLDGLRGIASPTLLEGRPPSGPDEIVLGSTTLRRLDARVGERVQVGAGSTVRSMLVVGRAVFPRLGQGSFTPTGLGEGAAVRTEALPGTGMAPGQYTFVLVRTKSGPSRALSAELKRVCDEVAGEGNPCAPSQRPADIENYAQMRDTPYVLTAILAALALATIGHAMITSVARRRRDLAVLKTIGFTRRQVSWSVAWQATTLIILALVVAVPLGMAAGRWGWTAFAGQLGVFPEHVTPLPALLAAGVAALLLANLVAALPARAAARTRPATVLRAE